MTYLVQLLLQDLLGHLQVLQPHPQLLVLLLQATPLLLEAVQLAVKTHGHVLRHLREDQEISPGGLWLFCAVFMLLFLLKCVMNNSQYQATMQHKIESFRATIFKMPLT